MGVFYYVKVPIIVCISIRIMEKKSTVGRHPVLSDLMCKIICKQLEIPSF